MDSTKDETSSYVTYGMLHKNHEFVDWVRVDLEEDDMVRVQNANANILDDNSLKDMDERAFEKLKFQWQEISLSEAITKSGSETNLAKVQDSILLGKKLMASATAKTLTPETISYGVFDADWNPVKLTPRQTDMDVAILLDAASKEGNSKGLRTYLTEEKPTRDGKLPIVPVKQSIQKQFLMKQSVQLFFRQGSIQMFAAFPYRHSPRTIYRFDLVNGGIDHSFWQKMQIDNAAGPSMNDKMNDKIIEMKSKMIINTAEMQKSLKTGSERFSNNFNTTVASTRDSIMNLTNKKTLLTSNTNDEAAAEKPKPVPVKQRFGMMRKKMASNPFMKNPLLKTNQNKASQDEGGNKEAETPPPTGQPPATPAPATNKLSQMKLRMSENTSRMRFGFGKKNAAPAEPTEKQNMTEKLNQMKLRMSESTNQMKQRMTENTTQMKIRMSENTTQMKERMAQNTQTMKTSLATKTPFWKKTAEAESKDAEEISFLSEEEFTFTIDGEDDDDESGLMSSLAVPAASPKVSSPSGYVALTFDDAPCRFDDRSHSQLENVLDLLKKYDAKATFMVISSFLADCHEADMIRLLQEGHELGNHGTHDESMEKATTVESFVEQIEECNSKIEELQTKANAEVGVKWFRAPHAKYTKTMEAGLAQKEMYNVMCDAYAACPVVEDGPWIAEMLNKQIKTGSIALLHMPEKCGFREHTLEALEKLLAHLQKRNFKVVSVGELNKLSEEVAETKKQEAEAKKQEESKDAEEKVVSTEAEIEML